MSNFREIRRRAQPDGDGLHGRYATAVLAVRSLRGAASPLPRNQIMQYQSTGSPGSTQVLSRAAGRGRCGSVADAPRRHGPRLRSFWPRPRPAADDGLSRGTPAAGAAVRRLRPLSRQRQGCGRRRRLQRLRRPVGVPGRAEPGQRGRREEVAPVSSPVARCPWWAGQSLSRLLSHGGARTQAPAGSSSRPVKARPDRASSTLRPNGSDHAVAQGAV